MKGSNFFWYLLSVLSGFLIAGIILLLNTNNSSSAILIKPAPTPLPIKVYLSGDVENPGLYELPINSRLDDLVTLSGMQIPPGNEYNLASKLYDGQHINISSDPIIVRNLSDSPINLSEFEKININEATIEELIQLPGIGATKAKEIIIYRDSHGYFDTIEDILNVPGIGEATFGQLKDKIVTNSID
ncbi:MAG: helix-hairpin-helix domain-containing protein [Anaerolineaceae bacterium]|jgi:competence protein ComEA|nr:helix-hairpin-helix domain-containing protein [Anaerolineaceae bacterium]